MVRTTVKRLSVAVAVACVLVSCSADAGPRTAPSPTTSPSPSPTTPSTSEPTREPTNKPTGPSEPELPATAKAESRAGAEAFVRYYIELLNFAGRTGNTTELKRHASGCTSCENLASAFRRTYEQGGSYDTQGWRVYSQFTVPGSNGAWASLLEVRQTPMTWIRKAGAEPEQFPAKRLNLRFEVKRLSDRWSVTELTET